MAANIHILHFQVSTRISIARTPLAKCTHSRRYQPSIHTASILDLLNFFCYHRLSSDHHAQDIRRCQARHRRMFIFGVRLSVSFSSTYTNARTPLQQPPSRFHFYCLIHLAGLLCIDTWSVCAPKCVNETKSMISLCKLMRCMLRC